MPVTGVYVFGGEKAVSETLIENVFSADANLPSGMLYADRPANLYLQSSAANHPQM